MLLHTNKFAIKIAVYFFLHPLRIKRFQRTIIPGLDGNPFRIYKKFFLESIIIITNNNNNLSCNNNNHQSSISNGSQPNKEICPLSIQFELGRFYRRIRSNIAFYNSTFGKMRSPQTIQAQQLGPRLANSG